MTIDGRHISGWIKANREEGNAIRSFLRFLAVGAAGHGLHGCATEELLLPRDRLLGADGIHAQDDADDQEEEDSSLIITAQEDGIHADDTFTLNNGFIRIVECYEGIEAAHILLRGGKTDVTAIDDGLNAASKALSEAESGKRKKSHDFDITISGGEHSILAGADAIDSNGSILISGGITMAAGTNAMKEVPVDYPEVCVCRIEGGTLIASGGYGKNTQSFSEADNQACLLLKWKEEQPAGEAVTLKDGEKRY